LALKAEIKYGSFLKTVVGLTGYSMSKINQTMGLCRAFSEMEVVKYGSLLVPLWIAKNAIAKSNHSSISVAVAKKLLPKMRAKLEAGCTQSELDAMLVEARIASGRPIENRLPGRNYSLECVLRAAVKLSDDDKRRLIAALESTLSRPRGAK
jgi:hypothetical protein